MMQRRRQLCLSQGTDGHNYCSRKPTTVLEKLIMNDGLIRKQSKENPKAVRKKHMKKKTWRHARFQEKERVDLYG